MLDVLSRSQFGRQVLQSSRGYHLQRIRTTRYVAIGQQYFICLSFVSNEASSASSERTSSIVRRYPLPLSYSFAPTVGARHALCVNVRKRWERVGPCIRTARTHPTGSGPLRSPVPFFGTPLRRATRSPVTNAPGHPPPIWCVQRFFGGAGGQGCSLW